MQVKVHWIIDGIAELDVESPEAAEKEVEVLLQKLIADNPHLVDTLGASAIQGKAFLPGSEEDLDAQKS